MLRGWRGDTSMVYLSVFVLLEQNTNICGTQKQHNCVFHSSGGWETQKVWHLVEGLHSVVTSKLHLWLLPNGTSPQETGICVPQRRKSQTCQRPHFGLNVKHPAGAYVCEHLVPARGP